MKLTIITINRNNAAGLEKTIRSVLDQTCTAFEYVLVDGASTDGSVGIIRQYAERFGDRIKWISEPDKGIYNAMNKGIGMASGDYIQILNSGDSLVSRQVVGKMYEALEQSGFPSILYGNMLKDMPEGKLLRDRCFAGRDITLLGFIHGTLNHSPAYIRKSLFDQYGLYDESLRIVSDWKWYMQAIVLGKEKPVYADIDITLFDMSGISETNDALREEERRDCLAAMIPQQILKDYYDWDADIRVMRRIDRYPFIRRIVWFMDRALFKLEKRKKEFV